MVLFPPEFWTLEFWSLVHNLNQRYMNPSCDFKDKLKTGTFSVKGFCSTYANQFWVRCVPSPPPPSKFSFSWSGENMCSLTLQVVLQRILGICLWGQKQYLLPLSGLWYWAATDWSWRLIMPGSFIMSTSPHLTWLRAKWVWTFLGLLQVYSSLSENWHKPECLMALSFLC